MTPRSEKIVLDRITNRIDKLRPIDSETLSGLQEILLTSHEKWAEEISLLMSLIRYRRAGYRVSKSTDECETAYTMGIVVGMQKMAEAYDMKEIDNECSASSSERGSENEATAAWNRRTDT